MDKNSSDQGLKNLFNKKRSSIIVGALLFCLVVFGFGKIFSFVILVIASSPFIVIFWNTFGELIRRLLNWKGK